MSFDLNVIMHDYEKRVRECEVEMSNRVKEFYKNVKHYNNKEDNKMESTLLLNEIRQAIDAARETRRASTILKNSAVAAKSHVRLMVGREDWPEVIKEAKNLTHFLAEDTLNMIDQMNEAADSVSELQYLLDSMRV